jgi:hypothetical protein
MTYFFVSPSVADPGCLSQIPDPTFFYSGSELSPSRIPDPNCLHPGSRVRIKEFKYFNPKKTKKWFLSSRKYDPGCSFRIPDPYADFLPIPDPGAKKAPDPESGSATLVYTGLARINFPRIFCRICVVCTKDYMLSQFSGSQKIAVFEKNISVIFSFHKKQA